jgi:hypothetical protein
LSGHLVYATFCYLCDVYLIDEHRGRPRALESHDGDGLYRQLDVCLPPTSTATWRGPGARTRTFILEYPPLLPGSGVAQASALEYTRYCGR